MKIGDLVKVKNVSIYSNSYMQGIAGWEGLLLDIKDHNSKTTARCVVLIKGKTHWVWFNDLEPL